VGSLERRLEALEEAPARYPYGRGGTPMGGAVPLWAPPRPYERLSKKQPHGIMSL
jgi:hypothetical protein